MSDSNSDELAGIGFKPKGSVKAKVVASKAAFAPLSAAVAVAPAKKIKTAVSERPVASEKPKLVEAKLVEAKAPEPSGITGFVSSLFGPSNSSASTVLPVVKPSVVAPSIKPSVVTAAAPVKLSGYQPPSNSASSGPVTGYQPPIIPGAEAESPTLVVEELPTAATIVPSEVVPVIARPPQPVKKFSGFALPSDAPLLEKLSSDITKAFRGKDPIELKPVKEEGYRPINSATFSDFMIQTFSQHSPMLKRILEEGVDVLKEKHVPDPEACKKRDPKKIEIFYYQKFVRDYMTRGSPYRGILVYHGLGSGKTCTSIAAAEALYWGGQKKIYILTPASLKDNYIKDLGKCGYFPLRQNNFWTFYKLKGEGKEGDPAGYAWLTGGLGLPEDLVLAQKGGWIPNPEKPSNWDELSPAVREAIQRQQDVHVRFRFQFINYNGVSPKLLSNEAALLAAEGTSKFDNAVVVIDEIHNLVRTINGTQLGSIPMSKFIEKQEPREPTWSVRLATETPGYKYPRGYTLYRWLQNAVGAKIIALSATPMINYAQEFAILLNMIGGEQRMAEISLKTLPRSPSAATAVTEWAKKRPDIDYFKIEEGADRSLVINVTPVPYGFVKVVKGDYSTRGFVRLEPKDLKPVKEARERTMAAWAASLSAELKAGGLIGEGAPEPKLFTMPLLPDDGKVFVDTFINRSTLKLNYSKILKARAAGLISYYRGKSDDLMPRVGTDLKIMVDMSDYMFDAYMKIRKAELEKESDKEEEEDVGDVAKARGISYAEADLYAQATRMQNESFKCGSRAACNFVFPEDVPRPVINDKKQGIQLLGIETGRMISVDAVVPSNSSSSSSAAAAVVGEEPEEETSEPKTTPVDAEVKKLISNLMAGLERNADLYLNRSLAQFSPKFYIMQENLRKSAGPALVYSQFITLEGLGIFSAALRASPERYIPLDLEMVGGEWQIPETMMTEDALARPRYIIYTGQQDQDKRKRLLQLYNADLVNLSPRLAAQCKLMLKDATDNRDGRICRVFMINVAGAEGISLFNTRQVHIMEPYWNSVRLQQVTGRAIRLCSHMNLPWEDRVVDVFTYVSTFTKEQILRGNPKVMLADGKKTTDENIHNLALRKQELSDGLYEIAQTAAVDCQIHYHEHGGVTQCFTYKDGARPMFAYHPDWRKDIATAPL